MKSIFSLIAALLLFAPPSFAHSRVTNSAVVDFTPGDASLSSEDRDQIRNLVKDARGHSGVIAKVEVAVWSDKDRPLRGDLSKSDQNLANERAENIKNALKMSGLTESVKVFNMATGSNWVARAFMTSDAELDSVFAKKDAEIMRGDFKIIKDNGAPSKAVVIVKMKDKYGKMGDKEKNREATDMSTN